MDIWNNAKRKFSKKHKKSSNFELCKNLIKDFQVTNPKTKYKSDFIAFIKESKLEDFITKENEIIYVSTIHKAKGKEFDNVFILLNNFNAEPDDKKRLLYVAMTRAKSNLTIHYNGKFLNDISADNLIYKDDRTLYSSPKQLIFHLNHKDIQLGYFKFVQHRIKPLYSGQRLFINSEGLTNSEDEQIIKFSKRFKKIQKSLEEKGFQLTTAKINFILYWKSKDEKNIDEPEVKIVLPELCFEKI